ncbi:MAG: DUF664 domain-containing protein [Streptosporangiales bacterium]|nr:DUF664 domain-containing protein [Streptosporangiales bacterium]
MVTLVARETDERDALLNYLEAQRGALHRAAYGLTEEQARQTPSASALSVGGLIKHLTSVEFSWIQTNIAGRTDPDAPTEEAWGDNFRLLDDETLEGMQERYRQVAEETEKIIRALPDLDQEYELPKAPWFPDEPRTARWILLTMIQETARHAGHADIVRESLDGADAFTLIAKSSGSAMPWLDAD